MSLEKEAEFKAKRLAFVHECSCCGAQLTKVEDPYLHGWRKMSSRAPNGDIVVSNWCAQCGDEQNVPRLSG